MADTSSPAPCVFQNGDVFQGTLGPGSMPNGWGVYQWADGGVFEGDWKDGLKHGHGTYRWPSGAVYDGEWVNGHMHGKGTFTGRDGASYDGSWLDDLKHGKKRFPNGDTYEGLWKSGQASGPGLYKWANGNEYNGEWVAGKMCGRGTFVWVSGERYDGEWKDGKENGRGTFTWADGSYFDGFWRTGEKHGVGIWCPPPLGPSKPLGHGRTDSYSSPPRGAEGPPGRARSEDAGSPKGGDGGGGGGGGGEVMLREYDNGHLVREEAVPETERPKGDPVAGPPAKKTRKKREVVMGETIYKGAPSYDLMLQLQLGIRWSVGRVTPEPNRNLSERDFTDNTQESAVSTRFPRRGSSATPPHAAHDFKWKDYCPMVFRKLRERFGIDAGDYMLSLCGDQALRELSSPGKSGSVFFLSQDGHFIVKTMRKAEMVLLRQALLATYFKHVMQYKETLLTKFFGLHRVKPHGGRNVRFVVMGNLFCTTAKIDRRFDLKGSTYGRLTPAGYNPETKILKDLDLDYQLQLEEGCYERLMKQITVDCQLLEKCNIMDYSLLLGMSFRNRASSGQLPALAAGPAGAGAAAGAAGRKRPGLGPAGGGGGRSVGFDPAAADPSDPETERLAMEAAERLPKQGARPTGLDRTLSSVLKAKGGGRMQVVSGDLSDGAKSPEEDDEDDEDFAPEQILGENMPAEAVPGRWLQAPKGVVQGPLPKETRHVRLNFGIIDILQGYNLSKQVEHSWKSIVQGQENISAVNPVEYSRRFQEFMAHVFKPPAPGSQ